MIYKNTKFNKGYTLLFAVLVSALVLSVGISILNISKKEFLLASSARESTIAFFAADSGLECASYFDSQGVFYPNDDSYKTIINCFGNQPKQHNGSTPLYTSASPLSIYTFDMSINDRSCVSIKVSTDHATGSTTIESRGYNLGWSTASNNCDLASPRRVERALYYNY